MGIQWPLGRPLCLFAIFAQQALPDVTVQALLLLTIQRYIQLRYPIVPCERLNRYNSLKLGALWVISPLFWCSCMIAFAQRGLIDSTVHCHFDFPGLAFVLGKDVVFSVLPLVFIVFLNTRSILFLYNKKHRMLNRTRSVRFMSAPTLKVTKNIRTYGSNSGAAARRMRSKSMMNKNKRPNSKCDDKV